MHFFVLICLCAALSSPRMIQAIEPQEQFFHESNKTMMNQNRHSGTFLALDAKGDPVIVQWEKLDGKSAQLTTEIRNASDILIKTYTQQELEFAHKHPEEVKHEHFLKSLASLFESASIDWNFVESQINDIFHQFFTVTDFAQFCKEGESHIIVRATDLSTGKMLGFIQFISGSDYCADSIKVGMFGIDADAHDREIHEVLMSLIFKLIPGIQRLFIHVRSTSERALALYQSWGFVPMGGQQGYWTNLEYSIQGNTCLQKKAGLLD